MPNMDLERRSKSKNGSQSAPRSGPQILVKSGGSPPKYCQVDSNVVRELYYIIIIFEFIFHQVSNNNTK